MVLVGLNHFFLHATDVIGSEPAFLALTYLDLWLIERAQRLAGPRQPWGLWAAVGVVSYLAFGTRTIGVVLLAALWAENLLRSRSIQRGTLLATCTFAVPAILQSLWLDSGRRYLDQASPDFAILVTHAADYAQRMAGFWSNGYSKPAAALLAGGMSVLAIAGLVGQVRQRVTVREVFFVLYLGLILLWPTYGGERLLLPILPLWIAYALRALGPRWWAARPRWQFAAAIVFLAGAAASYAACFTKLATAPQPEGVCRPAAQELFAFIRQQTAPDAVIAFAKPRAMALFGARRAGACRRSNADEQLWDDLRFFAPTTSWSPGGTRSFPTTPIRSRRRCSAPSLPGIPPPSTKSIATPISPCTRLSTILACGPFSGRRG